MRPAALSPAARRDISAAARYIKADNPAAALAFREAVKRALDQLGTHPRSGVVRPQLADAPVRCWPLSGFPYLLIYDAAIDPPLVLRVLHGRRDLPALLRAR